MYLPGEDEALTLSTVSGCGVGGRRGLSYQTRRGPPGVVDVPCQTGERSRGRSEPALGQVARAARGERGRDSNARASTSAWLGRVQRMEGRGQGRSAAEQWIRYAFVVSRGWEKGRRRPLFVQAPLNALRWPTHPTAPTKPGPGDSHAARGSESMRSPAQPAAQLLISLADPRIPGTRTAIASRERAPCWPPPQHRSIAAQQGVCDGILETQSRMQWRVLGQGRCKRTHAGQVAGASQR